MYTTYVQRLSNKSRAKELISKTENYLHSISTSFHGQSSNTTIRGGLTQFQRKLFQYIDLFQEPNCFGIKDSLRRRDGVKLFPLQIKASNGFVSKMIICIKNYPVEHAVNQRPPTLFNFKWASVF